MYSIEFVQEVMDTAGLNAVGFRKLIFTVTPESNDVENKVDNTFDLTLDGFNSALITEAHFWGILLCLDPNTHLAR